MKKTFRILCSLCIFSLFLFIIACSTLKVIVKKKAPEITEGSKIAYFNNSFSERYFPTFLSIDGTVYRNRSNENLDKFKEIEQIANKEIAEYCTKFIAEKTGSKVKIIRSPLDVSNFDEVNLSTQEAAGKIASECEKINASYAFIPIMRVYVDKIWGMGESGKNYFESKVYICNKAGNIIGSGYISTEAEWVEPRDTTTYHILIKSSESLFKKMLNSIL